VSRRPSAAGTGASRAGTTTKWALREYAWFNTKSYGSSEEAGVHDVGQKTPNAWGLYDMHGNVSEWCQDWYDEYYYGKSPAVDPTGPTTGQSRVLRGGSGNHMPGLCRSARRNGGYPVVTSNEVGFRVVVEAGGGQK
jgi:formylglycine-generating enzyme required for sulfatase activity